MSFTEDTQEIRHKKINFGTKLSLKKVVDKLLFKKQLGLLVYTEYRGVNLYSDSVSYKSAQVLLDTIKYRELKEDETVYVTRNGSKHHAENCDSVNTRSQFDVARKKDDLEMMTKKEAEKRGYTSCSLCQFLR